MTDLRTILGRSAATLVVVGALAACGGGGGAGDDVATLGDGDAASEEDGGASGDEELTDAEREDVMLEFTECMREHGVDMPDPSQAAAGGGGDVVVRGGSGPKDSEEFEAAHEECGPILEEAFGEPEEMSPEEEAEMRDNALNFAKCMREHGIDMPDPEFSDGGRGFTMSVGGPGDSGPGFDPEDEDFQAAQEECQGELGFEEGRMGPGGGEVRIGGPAGGKGPANAVEDS
jgi:hypothetical protein